MNKWQTVIDFCNMNIRKVVERSELLRFCDNVASIHGTSFYGKYTSIDTYKNYLMKAGFLEKVTVGNRELRGKFYISMEIPHDISIGDVKALAYGDIDENGIRRIIGIPSRQEIPVHEESSVDWNITISTTGSAGSYSYPTARWLEEDNLEIELQDFGKRTCDGECNGCSGCDQFLDELKRKKEKEFISKDEMEF